MLASRKPMALVAIALVVVLLAVFGATASKSNSAIIGVGVACTITANSSYTAPVGPRLAVVNGLANVHCDGVVALVSVTTCVVRDSTPVSCGSDSFPAGYGGSMTVHHTCGYTTASHEFYTTIAVRIVGIFGGAVSGAISGGFFNVPRCY